jgi:hypothetical protein
VRPLDVKLELVQGFEETLNVELNVQIGVIDMERCCNDTGSIVKVATYRDHQRKDRRVYLDR